MASTPEETIARAAEAYVNGDHGTLAELLHPNVRMHGSHTVDNWRSRDEVAEGLAEELRRHASSSEQPSGDLVERALNLEPSGVFVGGDTAWWSERGSLVIDGTSYEDASWSTVLHREEGDWKIVHSHFSIHHRSGESAS